MRRNDREVSNMNDIVEIMEKCDSCSIAFFDEEYPYIVPLSFGYGYDGSTLELFFHGANEGKKLTLLQRNPKVAFEMSCSHKIISGHRGCDFSTDYESICGNGEMVLLEGDEKGYALTQLVKHYSKENTYEFHNKELNSVSVFKLKVHKVTGKRLIH
jgi:nitroimidazol reductase NimA-like FMN-containing flavoprotein (pyridoxamine 5'-phosphate oxidase superfamily)